MRRTKTIIPALAFCLLQCIMLVSSKGIPGYIFTADKVSNNLLKDSPKSLTYNDQDAKNLILHNLGMLDFNSQLSESTQGLISQYGSKNLIRQGKLNYVFFVEGGSSDNLVDFERKTFDKSSLKRQTALFDVCSGNESAECLLNTLFDTNKGSVLTSLKEQIGKETPEAYFYSGNYNTANLFPKSTLSTVFDRKGNTFILDENSNKQFKISKSLNSCVNDILKGQYTVNIEKGTITPTSSETPVLTAGENAKDYFQQFMSDICSVVGVSTLIRKDPNPSFFVFHISALGKLDQLLSQEESIVLHKIFNAAHEQFAKNVLSQYKSDAVSGQIFVLSPENSLAPENQDKVLLQLGSTNLVASRVLQEETTTASTGQTYDTTSVIFRSVCVIFVLITAWVCIEMFNIDIQKDSVVYAKFLAADYFRR